MSNQSNPPSKSRMGPGEDLVDKTIIDDLGIIGHGLNPDIVRTLAYLHMKI